MDTGWNHFLALIAFVGEGWEGGFIEEWRIEN